MAFGGRRPKPFSPEPRGVAQAVAKRDEVPPGTTKRVEVDGEAVLLCNVDGELYAVEDVCTHDGGPLD